MERWTVCFFWVMIVRLPIPLDFWLNCSAEILVHGDCILAVL